MATLRNINSDADLEKLLPGDMVRISFSGENTEDMVYLNCKRTEKKADTVYAFANPIPEQNTFFVWESALKHLQFPGEYIYLSTLYGNFRSVEAGTEEHKDITSLL